jgi:capsular polysaccharide biosynthesis protein
MRTIRWWAVLLPVVLGTVAGLAYSAVTRPTYTARAYVIVIAADVGDANAAVNFAQAYARIASQGDVLTDAALASQGAVTVADLTTSTRAASSPDAPVIEISATAPAADRSAVLANALALGLVATGTRQATGTRMTLTVLSAATAPTEPSSPPSKGVAGAVGAAAGILISGLLMLSGAGRRTGARHTDRWAERLAPAPTPPLPAPPPAAPTSPVAAPPPWPPERTPAANRTIHVPYSPPVAPSVPAPSPAVPVDAATTQVLPMMPRTDASLRAAPPSNDTSRR